MGRIGQLQGFIEESLERKQYINLYEENEHVCLSKPRHNKNFDKKNENIFKDYEEMKGRKYRGYTDSKDTLVTAMKRSRFFELISHENKVYKFRRVAPKMGNVEPIPVNLNSPESSGYYTESEPSPSRVCGVSHDINSGITDHSTADMSLVQDDMPLQEFTQKYISEVWGKGEVDKTEYFTSIPDWPTEVTVADLERQDVFDPSASHSTTGLKPSDTLNDNIPGMSPSDALNDNIHGMDSSDALKDNHTGMSSSDALKDNHSGMSSSITLNVVRLQPNILLAGNVKFLLLTADTS